MISCSVDLSIAEKRSPIIDGVSGCLWNLARQLHVTAAELCVELQQDLGIRRGAEGCWKQHEVSGDLRTRGQQTLQNVMLCICFVL